MTKGKSTVVKKGYTEIAQKYHNQRSIYQSRPLLDRFNKQIERKSKILDLGCGAGVPVSKFLASKGHKVTGIDFAEGMVKLARKNVPKAKFVQMDMTKLKFKANSFDGAVSFYAIIHVPREKHPKIYRDLRRVLKPGGIVLLNACGHETWEGYEEDYMGVRMFWSHYGPKRTLGMIKDIGFEILWSKTLAIGGERQFWILARNGK